MTENNQSLISSFLVADGIPRALHIWSDILEYTLKYTIEMKAVCTSCNKVHDHAPMFSKLRYLRMLLSICRTFNNLPVLRAHFCRISNFRGISTMKSTEPLAWMPRGNWEYGNPRYVTVVNLKSKPTKKISNRISHITWIGNDNLLKGMMKWEYGKNLPIFFMAHLNHLISETGDVLPDLKIPMFCAQYDRTPNAEYTYLHKMPKMTWKKTLYQPKDGPAPTLSSVKGKYHLLILGSPYNLFEIDNMNYFQTQKVEPIGKIDGKKVCFLVYSIRSLWRYRIFMKTDTLGKNPIYFRTNVL